MKKIKMIIFCLLLNMLLCNVLVAQTRIAVLPFTSEEKLSRAVLTYLTDVFTVEMVNSNDFVVVERAKLDAALKEMKFQSGEMFDESTAVELGKMSGAEMVFFGTVFLFGGRNVLSVKGMDIKTATLKYAKQANGVTDIQLEAAVKTIVSQITKDENGSSVYSNIYDNSEISIGTTKLSKPEQELYDKYIVDKWGISVGSKDDMRFYYKRHISGGVALSVLGGIFFITGAVLMGIGPFMSFIPFIVGAPIFVGGCTMLPLCSIPFLFASRIASIYYKTSGKKLTFIDRTSIGGGYDWDKKEVTVTMAIRL